MVEKTRIILLAIWIALMLTYLLGDVMRIFAGDFVAGEMGEGPASQWMWLGAAALMLIPIGMILATVMMGYPLVRWLTIVAAAILFVFNAIGLPTYPGLYDKVLIVVGLAINVLTIIQAWSWRIAP